ncbi:MAG: MFS transporter [Steroidobacteraceae bacterium]
MKEPTLIENTYRKVNRRLIPLLFVSWVVAQMDVLNVGFAQLQMKADLGLSDAVYGIGASVVLFTSILLQVPSNLLMARIGARLTFGRIMLAWLLASAAMAFVQTPGQFLAVRFATGVFAAGLWTAMLLYLTYWYPSGRRARVLSMFVLAPVVAGIMVGPISGWILSALHDVGALRGWQWMFLLESLPALVMAIVMLSGCPERPGNAQWLSATERRIIEHDLLEDARTARHGGVETFRQVLRDRRVYLLGLVNGAASFAIYSMYFFLPIMIGERGVTNVLHVGLYSAIPWVVGGAAMVMFARSSDRRLERRWHYLIASCTAAAGLLVLVATEGVVSGLIGITMLSTGLLCTVPVFWPIPAAFLTGSAAAGGLAFINAMGDLGGAASPTLLGMVRTATGTLAPIMLPIAAALVGTALLLMWKFPRGSVEERNPSQPAG